MSTINRILNFDNVSVACLIVGTGSFIYLYGRESIFLKHYVRFIQKYDGKEPVAVQNVSKYRLEAVLNNLKISDYNREFYNLFITKKMDPITCGATSVRQGVKIGIPEYYQAASIDAIKVATSTIQGTTIPWASEDGEKLAQSLSLSEDAKKFAMAKAVLMGDSFYHFYHAIFPPFFVWGYVAASQMILSFKKLHLRHGYLTLGTYVISGIFFGAMYIFCDSVLYLQYDKKSFEDTLKVSHAYILGGIEYTEKVVERNKALRNIIKKGDKYYDEDGDPLSLSSIATSGIPPSAKSKLAKEYLRQYEITQESWTPPPVNPNPHPINVF